MSLLDDARQMDCLCDASESMHSNWCILEIKPRIVAALEAAERLMGCDMPYDSRDYRFCVGCTAYYDGETYPASGPPTMVVKPHADDCPQQALVAALKGEVVP